MDGMQFYAWVREVREISLKWVRYYTIERGQIYPLGQHSVTATKEHVDKLVADVDWSNAVLVRAGLA